MKGLVPALFLPLTGALLFMACDPTKQVVMRNRTAHPVALVFEQHGADDTLLMELAPGEERSMLLGFGGWERPSRMVTVEGRCVGIAFENDHHFDAITVQALEGEMKVRRRYMLKNGLVLLVE